ncbi:MAG: hypothetical protein H0U56_10815 [Methylibium sp.]|nr:hypothetical protein [Methylibium sp.]
MDPHKGLGVGLGFSIGAALDVSSSSLLYTSSGQLAGHVRSTALKYRKRNQDNVEDVASEDASVESLKRRKQSSQSGVVEGAPSGPHSDRGTDNHLTFHSDVEQCFNALQHLYPGRIPVMVADGARTHKLVDGGRAVATKRKHELVDYLLLHGCWSAELELLAHNAEQISPDGVLLKQRKKSAKANGNTSADGSIPRTLSKDRVLEEIAAVRPERKAWSTPETLALKHGGVLLYLPNSHPQLNPVERVWRNIKTTRKFDGNARNQAELGAYIANRLRPGSINTSSINKYVHVSRQIGRAIFETNADVLPREEDVESKTWDARKPIPTTGALTAMGYANAAEFKRDGVENVLQCVQNYAHYLNTARVYTQKTFGLWPPFNVNLRADMTVKEQDQRLRETPAQLTGVEEPGRNIKHVNPTKTGVQSATPVVLSDDDDGEDDDLVAKFLTSIKQRKRGKNRNELNHNTGVVGDDNAAASCIVSGCGNESDIVMLASEHKFTEALGLANKRETPLTEDESRCIVEIKQRLKLIQQLDQTVPWPALGLATVSQADGWIDKLLATDAADSAHKLAKRTAEQFGAEAQKARETVLHIEESWARGDVLEFQPAFSAVEELREQLEELQQQDTLASTHIITAYMELLRAQCGNETYIDANLHLSNLLQSNDDELAQKRMRTNWMNTWCNKSTLMFPLCDNVHFCLMVVNTAKKTVCRYDSIERYKSFGILHVRMRELFDTLHEAGYVRETANVIQQPIGSVDCGIHTMLNARAVLEKRNIQDYERRRGKRSRTAKQQCSSGACTLQMRSAAGNSSHSQKTRCPWRPNTNKDT